MRKAVDVGLTPAVALAVLLSTESLLFAAFQFAVNLSDGGPRVRNWVISGPWLATIAVVALAVVAVGAGAAWFDLFLDAGFPTRIADQLVAGALATAIAIQPLLALFLALGLRRS